MKKLTVIFILCLCLALSACGIRPPEKASDGTPWNSDWTTMGSIMGVEKPEGWNLERSEDVLAAEGMFYNVWTMGEAMTYTNENGDEVTAYEAEIHLVAAQSDSPDKAAQMAADWETLTEERYPDRESSTAEYAGQTFTVSAYPEGACATGIRNNCAIRVDVIAREGFDKDPAQVLADFLNHCHYAE